MTTTSLTNQELQNNKINTSSVQFQIDPLDSITVYYGNVIKNSYPQPKNLSWIVQQIRNSADLKQRVSQVRSTTNDKSRQGKKEALLPYFCFQKFKNNHRVNAEFDSTKYVIQDLDHLSSRLIDIRSKLVLDNDVFMVFSSPSGDGLKVVFELDQPVIGIDQYRYEFDRFATFLRKKYGIPVDDNDDPSRACYLSSDPDIHINLNRKLHSVSAPKPAAQSTKRLTQIVTALNGSASPGRTDAMSTLIGVLNQRGVEEHVALSLIQSWNKDNNRPPLPHDKVAATVKDEYERYKSQSSIQPVRIISQDNCYITVSGRSGKNIKTQITNFFIEPKELLMLKGSDCLTCSVTTTQGVKYDDIILENTDWHSRAKLLKAIGHQDCSFFGNDSDVQNLCSHINSNVPIRKNGSKVIGLVNDTWVVEGMNITSSGKCSSMSIIPYQKGTDAFYHKIVYQELDDVSYTQLMQDFYSNITSLNSPETILPILGWNFAAPIKPVLMEQVGSFPLMFIHGGQGGGKTSTVKLFMRLHGYKDDKPQMCDMKPFPMLKLLSSTNAIPVILDEFKMKDMKQESIDNLLRFMRKSYDGEVETKGRADQTTESYNLDAPLVVMGEWNINQPAIKERIVFPRFSGVAKKDKAMQAAFQKIFSLPLEGFMPRYIEYCLGVDMKNKYGIAARYVRAVFREHTVAPRIVHNLSTMVLGLMLFRDYGRFHNVVVPQMNYKVILKSQLKEITGNDTGMVSSAVDQLFEALAVYAQYREKTVYNQAAPTDPLPIQPKWFKLVNLVEDKNIINCLAIQFNQVFPEFKEYAKRTNYEGDLLDTDSFRKLFDECPYIFESSHVVDFKSSKIRCVCIDTKKAKEADINLEGFGLESKTKAPTQTPQHRNAVSGL